MTKERSLEDSILDFLSYLGITARKMYTFRHDSGNEKDIEVSPDPISSDAIPFVIGSVDSVVVAIRIQTELGRKETAAETKFIQKVKAAGGIGFSAWSVNDVALGLAKYWPESLTQNH